MFEKLFSKEVFALICEIALKKGVRILHLSKRVIG